MSLQQRYRKSIRRLRALHVTTRATVLIALCCFGLLGDDLAQAQPVTASPTTDQAESDFGPLIHVEAVEVSGNSSRGVLSRIKGTAPQVPHLSRLLAATVCIRGRLALAPKIVASQLRITVSYISFIIASHHLSIQLLLRVYLRARIRFARYDRQGTCSIFSSASGPSSRGT